ncbi:hypothetical protein SAMN04487941_1930 [Pontibacter akesuensis]|uniref:Uncharacterized protein n=2 Tax=Pontibacter akesuensis TaxID=388950 RepID=A0A1I7I5F2_9BACT|nr:hypothetical protein SAMN04487941_1930 [Pontibacter akesuensis]
MQSTSLNHMFYYGALRTTTKKMPVKGKYKILFKDGSEDVVETRVLSAKSKDYFSYKLLNEKVTVYPEDTKSVTRLWDEFEVAGEPFGDHWLFKTIEGSINGYSKLPNTTGAESLLFIQKGDGERLPFNPTNVLELVNDQEGGNEALNNGDYFGAIVEYNQKKSNNSSCERLEEDRPLLRGPDARGTFGLREVFD